MRHSFWGTTLLIAGTTIGAGMLALPLTVALLGLFWGLISLAAFWAIMTYAAFLGLSLVVSESKTYPITRLFSLAYGSWGNGGVLLICLALFWSLLAAYLTGMTSLCFTYGGQWGLSLSHVSLLIGLGLGLIISAPIQWIDFSNRFLMCAKGVCFVGLLGILSTQLEVSSIVQGLTIKQPPFESIWLALPVLFSAFGFHGSMHTFVDYAKRDLGTLRKAFIVGGFIPLAIYVLWVFFSLGACMRLDVDIFARIVGESMDLNDFIRLLSEVTANPWLGVGVWGFSFLAILTSAIGVGLGLRDIWMETLAHAIKPRLLRLWISAILTLALPLYVSMEHPGAFIAIIRFAAIFLSFIAIIFPCMVLWRFRHSNRMGSYRMWGESLIALLLFLIGIIIIGAEIYTIM